MKIVTAINMNNLEWDYKGWIKRHPSLSLQEDWNQTLMTIINQMGVILHIDSRLTPNVITINPVLLHIFETLLYFNSDENGQTLFGKYVITLDDTAPKDIVTVMIENASITKALNENKNLCFTNRNGELTLEVLTIGSTEYLLAEADQSSTILTKDKLCGKIKILNYI